MIHWMDFVLDDIFGPCLRLAEGQEDRASTLNPPLIMEDEGNQGSEKSLPIQETSRSSQPARMVGESDLESKNPGGMDAARSVLEEYTRYEGTG